MEHWDHLVFWCSQMRASVSKLRCTSTSPKIPMAISKPSSAPICLGTCKAQLLFLIGYISWYSPYFIVSDHLKHPMLINKFLGATFQYSKTKTYPSEYWWSFNFMSFNIRINKHENVLIFSLLRWIIRLWKALHKVEEQWSHLGFIQPKQSMEQLKCFYSTMLVRPVLLLQLRSGKWILLSFGLIQMMMMTTIGNHLRPVSSCAVLII